MTPSILTPFLNLLEKAGWTFVQAVLAVLAVAGALDVSTIETAAMAGLAAAFTVVIHNLPAAPLGLPFWADTAWRMTCTFIASTLGFLLALPALDLSYTSLQAAGTAGITATIVVFKSAVARLIGDPDSPATLPARYTLAA